MWQRFTERARKVVFYAQEEAQRFKHKSVDTEHLLLGLCRESDSIAVRVLAMLGVTCGAIRAEVENKFAGRTPEEAKDFTLTALGKQVIDSAYEEAQRLKNNYIGTEHLLLGILRVEEGLGSKSLRHLGVEIDKARELTAQIQDASIAQAKEPSEPQASAMLLMLKKQAEELTAKMKDPAGCMARMLLVRQGRTRLDNFALLLLAENPPAMASCLEMLGLNRDEIMTHIERSLVAKFEIEPIADMVSVEDLFSAAVEESDLAGGPFSIASFLPAFVRVGGNEVNAYLLEKRISIEDVRRAMREANG